MNANTTLLATLESNRFYRGYYATIQCFSEEYDRIIDVDGVVLEISESSIVFQIQDGKNSLTGGCYGMQLTIEKKYIFDMKLNRELYKQYKVKVSDDMHKMRPRKYVNKELGRTLEIMKKNITKGLKNVDCPRCYLVQDIWHSSLKMQNTPENAHTIMEKMNDEDIKRQGIQIDDLPYFLDLVQRFKLHDLVEPELQQCIQVINTTYKIPEHLDNVDYHSALLILSNCHEFEQIFKAAYRKFHGGNAEEYALQYAALSQDVDAFLRCLLEQFYFLSGEEYAEKNTWYLLSYFEGEDRRKIIEEARVHENKGIGRILE